MRSTILYSPKGKHNYRGWRHKASFLPLYSPQCLAQTEVCGTIWFSCSRKDHSDLSFLFVFIGIKAFYKSPDTIPIYLHTRILFLPPRTFLYNSHNKPEEMGKVWDYALAPLVKLTSIPRGVFCAKAVL